GRTPASPRLASAFSLQAAPKSDTTRTKARDPVDERNTAPGILPDRPTGYPVPPTPGLTGPFGTKVDAVDCGVQRLLVAPSLVNRLDDDSLPPPPSRHLRYARVIV